MMHSSVATTIENLMRKVNESMYLSAGELSETDMRGGIDHFLVSLRIL